MLNDTAINVDFRSPTFVTQIPTFLDGFGIYNALHSPSKNCYTELHSGIVAKNKKSWKKIEDKNSIIAKGIESFRKHDGYLFYSDLGNYLLNLGLLTVKRTEPDKDRMYKCTINLLNVFKLTIHCHTFDRMDDIFNIFFVHLSDFLNP